MWEIHIMWILQNRFNIYIIAVSSNRVFTSPHVNSPPHDPSHMRSRLHNIYNTRHHQPQVIIHIKKWNFSHPQHLSHFGHSLREQSKAKHTINTICRLSTSTLICSQPKTTPFVRCPVSLRVLESLDTAFFYWLIWYCTPTFRLPPPPPPYTQTSFTVGRWLFLSTYLIAMMMLMMRIV